MSESLVHGSGLSLISRDGICTLTFNAPKNKNAITFEQAEFLGTLCARGSQGTSEIERFLKDTEASLLVLKSALDDVFLSGGDLREIETFSEERGTLFTERMRAFCIEMRRLPVPTITLLGGPAYGGGTEVALSTDFRWSVNQTAALHFWQTRWGVPGGWNGMARLQEIVPSWDSRKVALLFICQTSLDHAALTRTGVVDLDFSSAGLREMETSLKKMVLNFENCAPQLRSGLLARPEPVSIAPREALHAYDASLFNAHWLGNYHRSQVSSFTRKGQP